MNHKKEQIIGYYARAIRLSLPSVESVACVTTLPSDWNWKWTECSTACPACKNAVQRCTDSHAGFFVTLPMPLERERIGSEADRSPMMVRSDL